MDEIIGETHWDYRPPRESQISRPYSTDSSESPVKPFGYTLGIAILIAFVYFGYRISGVTGALVGGVAAPCFWFLFIHVAPGLWNMGLAMPDAQARATATAAALLCLIGIFVLVFITPGLRVLSDRWSDPWIKWSLFYAVISSIYRIVQARNPNYRFDAPPIAERFGTPVLSALWLIAIVLALSQLSKSHL